MHRCDSRYVGSSAGDGGLLGLDRGVPLPLGRLPAVLGVTAAPVAGDRGELAGQPVRLAQVPAQLPDGAGLTVHEQCPVPSGSAAERTAATRASPGAASPRCTQVSETPSRRTRSVCSSSGPATSTNASARAPAGSRSRAAAIAGSALSSPASRCQSASGDGAYPPPGPKNWIRSPGCAAAAHGPASPSSPCQTKSTVSSPAAASQPRTV